MVNSVLPNRFESFSVLLKQELLSVRSRYYSDNYDYYTFGSKRPFKKVFVNFLKRLFFSSPILGVLVGNNFLYRKVFLGYLLHFDRYMPALEFFYNSLASEESRKLLIRLIAFRLLGYVKVRLPLSTPDYWQGIKEIENLQKLDDFVELRSFPWKLYMHDLHSKGLPIRVYINSKAAYTTFVLQQYVKVDGTRNLGPKPGEVVLDLGGCYGDTAILFSHLVEKEGKVYSFEFIPGNVIVFRKNLSLNLANKENVEIVQNPLWNESGKKMYYKDAGAASTLRFEKFEGMGGETETITVDDFVAARKLAKVDFIKSDIEGAEPLMLKGAERTIRKFTPTLAISIYHNMNDFCNIIKQISDMGLGYKFYLGHYTIYASETILYAIPCNKAAV